MAKSTAYHDQRPTELYASLTMQWARQAAAYFRSVRLYQEQSSRRRRGRTGAPERAAQLDPTLRRRQAGIEIVDLPTGAVGRPSLGLAAPPSGPASQGQATEKCPLTPRQLEIAELIAQGLTNTQISERIVVSRGTVGNHVGHMLRRLGFQNRAQIAAWAIRQSQGYDLSQRHA
jgi:DNA-binding CsgD family transcriptional regulator